MASILFYVIRQFMNSLLVLVAQAFWSAFLPFRSKWQKRKKQAFLLHFLIILTIDLMRGLPLMNTPSFFLILTASYFIVQFAVLLFVYSGSLVSKLFLFIINKIIEAFFISLWQTMLSGHFSNVNFYFPEDPDFAQLLIFFSSLLIGYALISAAFVGFAQLLRKMFQKPQALFTIVFIPVSQFLILFTYFFTVGTSPWGWEPSWRSVTLTLAVLMCLLGDLALFTTLFRLRENNQMQEQLKLSRAQQQYYELLEKQQQQIREFQHDIGNHLATIQALAKAPEKQAEIDEYSKQLLVQNNDLLRLDYCENRALNALLVEKSLTCSSYQIETDFQITLPQTTFLDDVSLVSLFSNLLDNAIDAACCSNERFIHLHVSTPASTVTIQCRNSFTPGIRGSRRSYKLSHGNGKRILKRIVSRFNGEILFDSAQDNTYCVSIVLFKPEEL